MVVSRTRGLALILVCALLAGCLGGSDDVGPSEAEDPSGDSWGEDPDGVNGGNDTAGGSGIGPSYQPAAATALERELEAYRLVPDDSGRHGTRNVSADDWYLLSTASSDAGRVVAFAFEVPPGGLVTGDGLILEFAPVLDPLGLDALPGDTVFAALLVDDEGAVQDYYVQGRIEVMTDSGEDTVLPSSQPFSLRGSGLSQGDEVYLLVAARDGASEFGFGMRVLTTEVEEHEATVGSWGEFHSAVKADTAPFVPARVAEGTGLHFAVYTEIHDSSGFIIEQTRDVTVNDDLPDVLYPTLRPRVLAVGSVAEWEGWSKMHARYLSAGEPGEWRITADLHGSRTAADEGYFLNMHFEEALPIQGELPPTLNGHGDGSSGASLELSLTKGGTAITREELTFRHLAVGLRPSGITGSEGDAALSLAGGLPLPSP